MQGRAFYTIVKHTSMFDRNNSFEPALPCRPRICLRHTLRSYLFQRPPDTISRVHANLAGASPSASYTPLDHLLGREPNTFYYGTPYEIRTRVLAVKGRYPRPLDERCISFTTYFYKDRLLQ